MTSTRPLLLNAKGFTLIEVLLAVSVFAIVLGAINSVFF
ncbi:MAG: PulJ/GspJ family protein, partial [Limisphaerales bacterium]